MGALAHYLEAEGIPTTQISLIREHTEKIRPPRALWVPFELGRPLGAPEDPAFQRRVLLAALSLLEVREGPVLQDFPDDAPEAAFGEALEGWACPVNLTAEISQETDLEKLLSTFKREVTELRPWYDLRLKRRKRTSVAVFDPFAASELLSGFAAGEMPEITEKDLSLATALRLAGQDLKAFYFEATMARPGSTSPTSAELSRWFWQETAAGRILMSVKERCLKKADESLRKTGAMLLVPLDQA